MFVEILEKWKRVIFADIVVAILHSPLHATQTVAVSKFKRTKNLNKNRKPERIIRWLSTHGYAKQRLAWWASILRYVGE